jgi:hypothetical protein
MCFGANAYGSLEYLILVGLCLICDLYAYMFALNTADVRFARIALLLLDV